MIQDREVKGLWDAVEDIRRRVEEMEGDGPSESGVGDYVASVTSNRKTFHLRGCKFTRGFINVTDGFQEFNSHDEAVAAGMVPCKSCFT